MQIQTTYQNATEGYIVGEEEIALEDSIFDGKTEGDIYRWCLKEHGRCIGKVYVDNGTPVGWVYVKTDHYEDTREPYLLETWVTLVDKDETVRNVEYHEIGRAPALSTAGGTGKGTA
jgi:hypothetical protein